MASWDTIESDPGVFTAMVSKLGVKDMQFQEIISMDDDSLKRLGQVYGVIFLFRFRKADYDKDDRPTVGGAAGSSGIYFAKQTVNNACATQAIVNILLNSGDRVQIGQILSDFKSFTAEMPPQMRGDTIGQHDAIRKTHNSFARQEPFVFESTKAKDEDDVFHFIGYMPKSGKVYELDGLKPGPICLGPFAAAAGGAASDLDWMRVMRPEIQRRMSKFKAGEIHFNLMAITRDRSAAAEEELAAIAKQTAEAEAKASESDGPETMAAMASAVLQSRAVELRQLLASQAELKARWASENKRRQHNYLPFIMALLKKLAAAKKLQAMREAGDKVVADALKQKQEAAKKAKGNATSDQ